MRRSQGRLGFGPFVVVEAIGILGQCLAEPLVMEPVKPPSFRHSAEIHELRPRRHLSLPVVAFGDDGCEVSLCDSGIDRQTFGSATVRSASDPELRGTFPMREQTAQEKRAHKARAPVAVPVQRAESRSGLTGTE